MFGLFAAEGSAVEKRFLQFSDSADEVDGRPVDGLHDTMEVRAFRAKGRKRIAPEVEILEKDSSSPKEKAKKGFKQGVTKEGSVKYDNPTMPIKEENITLTLN